MKRYISIVTAVLLSSLTFGSCGKWLDIIPEDTTTEEQQFSDAGGYHSALNGIYQTISGNSLYGRNLTWGFLSALSQYYDNKSASNSLRFSYTEKYDYASDEVRGYGTEIWESAYNVIANCNNLIQHVDNTDPSVFPDYDYGEADIIKGEAIAVRALLHFDLLRLFAESPAANPEAKGIPYVKKFPQLFNSRLSAKEVLDNVISDLKEASELLSASDSVSGYLEKNISSISYRYSSSNSERNYFFSARGVRMNYIAVNSLLARVYAYSGNMEAAYERAAFITDTFVEKNKWYRYDNDFRDSDLENKRSHKLLRELLVSFYQENLVDSYNRSANFQDDNSYKLKNLRGIFADADDFRVTKLIHNVTSDIKISLKYLERADNPDMVKAENGVLPVMRLSELDLIKAEYLSSQEGKMAEAVKILNNLRVKRGCTGNTIPETISKEDFDKALGLEVWRENVAEGQYFFYCKRLNLPSINNDGVTVPMAGKYTMLIPESETTLN